MRRAIGREFVGLWLCLGLGLASLPFPLRAGEPSSAADQGPQRLKQEVHIVVETNAVPVAGQTNALPAKPKSFTWKARWAGWGGLHTEVTQRTPLKDPFAAWRERIEGTNASRTFHLEQLKMSGKIGAKFALDGAAFVTGEALDGFDSGVELRRARIYGQGDCLLLLPVSYELEVGYIPDEFYIEKSYLAFKDIPGIGEFRGGQFQAPMSLDMITSSRDLSFMEPAAPVQALAPGANAGLQIGKPVLKERATWRLGLFTDGVGQDFGDASEQYGRAITRITALPFDRADPDEPGTARFLHVGLSANVLYSASDSVRYQARPESHLAPHVVDTGTMEADGSLVVGTEVAWVHGRFSVQGEYLHSWVRELDGEIPQFQGLYASASWFLTGESRPYSRQEGRFDRVIPKRDFDWGRGGWGAWEVVGRCSHVDLEDADIRGGRLTLLMGGLNWYLHPHVKWRFDYGFGHISGRDPEGNVHIFETRVEVDF